MGPKTTTKKRIGPARDRRVWLEKRAFDLSKHCPVDHANPVECPLFDLRPMKAAKRKIWIHQLSDDELEYLATYHTCCLAVKTAPAGT